MSPASSLSTISFDDLPSGIILVRDDAGVVGANAAALAMLGCDLPWLVGQRLSAVMTRGSAVLYQAVVYQQLRASGRVHETYLDFRTRDGADVPVLCSASVQAKDGETLIVLSVTLMAERRLIEADLLRTRRIAEQVPGVVYQYLMTPDGAQSMPYASEALRTLFGVDPAEVATDAAMLLTAIHPEDIEAFALSVQESARALSPWRMQFRSRREDSGPWRWVEGRSTPERLSDGSTLWHGFVQDITSIKNFEDALREKETAERESKAKSEFLARVSHELRTPLNAILGFAQVLILDTAQPLKATQIARVRHIEAAGRDLLGLIDEVLDITGIESGTIVLEPEWLNLKSKFTRVCRLVEEEARERDIEIELSVHSTLSAHADPARLAQIIAILLSNAVKRVDIGGKVMASCIVENRQMIISIRDNGPGMTSEQLQHLFEPFNELGAERTTAKPSGLGLVIVKRLVEAMKGSIEVCNGADAGAVLCVTLPQRALESAGAYELTPVVNSTIASPTASAPLVDPRAPHSRTPVVLYVEDNPVNAMIMEAIFEMQEGVVLHVETDGAAAIEWVRRNPVDMLLLDMNLPDTDGIQLLKKLRRLEGIAEIEAVAVSADAMPDYLEQARLAGFNDYWTKPLNVSATLDKVAYSLGIARTLQPSASTFSPRLAA